MGAMWNEIPGDFERLKYRCCKLNLKLPESFVYFFENPALWGKFRSTNCGIFNISEKPINCPVSKGFLVPFISDSQYTHYHYLHLVPFDDSHQVIWTDDLYYLAIKASPGEFEKEYKNEFDEKEIYLLDNNFEHFLKCHYENHENWLKNNGY